MYKKYIDNLDKININQMVALIDNADEEIAAYAAARAAEAAAGSFNKGVFIRGLIEFTNCCRNNCLYCGIRCANKAIHRYRMTEDQILECCRRGYEMGIRTFVLQGGEDDYYTDQVMAGLVGKIKEYYPECAVTLSIGERPFESYKALFEAGADRYLLRHETADREHYAMLHPGTMRLESRMDCLCDLKSIGYQTGCGMMIGSPYQTSQTLARDLAFIRDFRPHMVGIGPFLPNSQTPFADRPAGSLDMTLFIISLVRLIDPQLMIPATTAVEAAEAGGIMRAFNAGANVYMVNLSPAENINQYLLYDSKAKLIGEPEACLAGLRETLQANGFHINMGRGDYEGI